MHMGFFDFLWGKDKKNESQDASWAGTAPVVFGDSDQDSDSSGSDTGADASAGDGGSGGGGDGGGS